MLTPQFLLPLAEELVVATYADRQALKAAA
jgi:hypothetical protein